MKQEVSPLLLNLPEQWLSGNPTPNRYPKRFNPDAKSIWSIILESELYEMETKGATSLSKWTTAVTMFIQNTLSNDIQPFDSLYKNEVVDNSVVKSLLARGRRLVAKFFNSSELLTEFKVRDTGWVIKPTLHGFTFTSYIELLTDKPILDWSDYLKAEHRFRVEPTSKRTLTLSRMLDPVCRVYVEFKGGSRIRMYYTLVINHSVYHPVLSEGGKVTKDEYATWIYEKLWKENLNLYPITATSRRTKF